MNRTIIEVNRANIVVQARETYTSGAVRAFSVEFQFDGSWSELDKVPTFRAGGVKRSAELGEDNCCLIPWEVLETPRVTLEASVMGRRADGTEVPTTWVKLGVIQEGSTTGENATVPTGSAYHALIEQISQAQAAAQQAAEDAKAAAERAEAAVGGGGGNSEGASDSNGVIEFDDLDDSGDTDSPSDGSGESVDPVDPVIDENGVIIF